MIHPLLNDPDSFLYVGQISPEEMELVERCVEYCVPHLEHKPEIIVFGKKCKQQRNVGFFSNESVGYEYSTQIMRAQPLTTDLEQLMAMVNARFNANYNGILCNEYPDGEHVVGAHSDAEGALDKNSGVVSISWGATRIFRIRHKASNHIITDVYASHGSIIQMGGKRFQREYTHEIPKQMRIKEGRVSFTFRCHIK